MSHLLVLSIPSPLPDSKKLCCLTYCNNLQFPFGKFRCIQNGQIAPLTSIVETFKVMWLFPIRIIWIRILTNFSVIMFLSITTESNLHFKLFLSSLPLAILSSFLFHSSPKPQQHALKITDKIAIQLRGKYQVIFPASCWLVARSENKEQDFPAGPREAKPWKVGVLCWHLIEDKKKWKALSTTARDIEPWYRLKLRNAVIPTVSTAADCKLRFETKGKAALGSDTMCFLFPYYVLRTGNRVDLTS